MTENTTHQPILTDIEILELFRFGESPERIIKNGRAIESALLSKLRAEGVQAGDERAKFETDYLERHGPLACFVLHDDGDYWDPKTRACWASWRSRAALASAPVAGEANAALNEWFDKTDFIQKRIASGELPVKYLGWHRADVMRDLIEQPRPSDDKLWDQTLTERDEYHDMADKLAEAIADHLLVEIGEHSSSNCPWMRALEAIENAAPQASEAVRTPDYTLQHADHMAVSAEQLMEAINARDAVIMQLEESDDVDDETMQEHHENVSEFLSGMRNAIYEYRKRRNRAALSPTPSVVKQSLTATQTGEKGESDA